MTLGSRSFFYDLVKETRNAVRKVGKFYDLKKPEKTRMMLGDGDSRKNEDFGLIGRIGQRYGYQIQAEWMRIDQVWYYDINENDEWNFLPWVTDAIIEHENNIDDFIRTIVKLTEYSAPIKIAIFYPKRDDEEKWVGIASEIISKRQVSYPGESYLLVFGLYDKKKNLYWNAHEINWQGKVHPVPNHNER